MLKEVLWFWKVEEVLGSKVGTDEHPVIHFESAIQRSLEKRGGRVCISLWDGKKNIR